MTITIPLHLTIPYGQEDTVSYYVRDATLGDKDFTDFIDDFRVEIEQNEIANGSMTLLGVDSAEKQWLLRWNEVLVFVSNTFLYKFIIDTVSFDKEGNARINLECTITKAKRSMTDRSTYSYENTVSNTITNALISGIFSQGTISNLGRMFFKAEYDTKLKALIDQAKYLNAEWYMTQKVDDRYSTDYYNIEQTRGDGVSKITFKANEDDENCYIINKTEEQSNVVNYVIVMGAGSGNSQLSSLNYHATINRNYLNGGDTWLSSALNSTATTISVDSTAGFPSTGTITIDKETITYTGTSGGNSFTGCTRGASGTSAASHINRTGVINRTTLIVDDNSSLPNSGNVWIGIEKVTYTGKTSTTQLTGITRGASSTPVYAHSDNIEVWDAQYLTTSPQTGSSIQSEADVLEGRYDFLSVNDQNTLDMIAQLIQSDKKTLKPNILISPINMYEVLGDKGIKVGDTVTVVDHETNLNADYRVLSIKIARSRYGDDSCELILSAKKRDILKELNKLYINSQNATTHSQPSQNIWGDTQASQANATVPLKLSFYVPKDLIDASGKTKLIDAKLSYSTVAYNKYTGALSGSTGNSTSNATYANVASVSNNTYSDKTKGSSDNGYTLPAAAISYLDSDQTTYSSFHSMDSGVNTGAYTFGFHAIIGQVNIYRAAALGSYTIYVRAYNSTDGTYYPNSYGILAGFTSAGYVRNSADTGSVQILGCVSFSFLIPMNWTSKTYYLQVQVVGTSTSTTWSVDYRYYGIVGHAHGNIFSDAEHTNSNVWGDANHANPSGTLNADYALAAGTQDSTNTTIEIYNGNNTLLWSSGSRGATEESEIDISAYITESDYYTILIYPNNNCLLYGTVFISGGLND